MDGTATKSREMALTEELVARCHRVLEDAGPEPGLGYLDEADYEAMLDATLARRPAGSGLWLFAYGSLIWKPEVEHAERRIATARGWHRAFCIRQTRWRGTLDRPGLMMALMKGGQCRGVAFRLAAGDERAQLRALFKREMTAKPTTYRPAWMKLDTADGPLAALGFVANPKGRTFAGKIEEARAAEILAGACGHVGSGAEYLYNTVLHLEALGIHDRHLWRLQEQVARAIAARGSDVLMPHRDEAAAGDAAMVRGGKTTGSGLPRK